MSYDAGDDVPVHAETPIGEIDEMAVGVYAAGGDGTGVGAVEQEFPAEGDDAGPVIADPSDRELGENAVAAQPTSGDAAEVEVVEEELPADGDDVVPALEEPSVRERDEDAVAPQPSGSDGAVREGAVVVVEEQFPGQGDSSGCRKVSLSRTPGIAPTRLLSRDR
ncbi:hypothetical protein [Streptomyces sp. NPDC058613]|uniref:hypothetical protein n=1 Tax=Streptomyces sp. NPDC058613 TaxID=3346556 RepID=UPI0036543B95